MFLITEMYWKSQDLSEILRTLYNDGLLQMQKSSYFLFWTVVNRPFTTSSTSNVLRLLSGVPLLKRMGHL